MKAMICKQEKGFEPVFFDVNTLDDLLNALGKYSYPPMQINIEDDAHGNPRMGIELFDESETLIIESYERVTIHKSHIPKLLDSLCWLDSDTVFAWASENLIGGHEISDEEIEEAFEPKLVFECPETDVSIDVVKLKPSDIKISIDGEIVGTMATIGDQDV